MPRRPTLLLLLLLAAPIAAGESSLADAAAVWRLSDGRDAIAAHHLETVGTVSFATLDGDELKRSLARGGDGHIAVFTGNGRLALPATAGADLVAAEEVTILVRLQPAGGGGVIHLNTCSLVIHPSGLLVAMVAEQGGIGQQMREIPLVVLPRDEWHDVVLRRTRQQLDLIIDGVRRAQVPLIGRANTILTGPLLLGAWRIDEPDLPYFPPSSYRWLYERPFTGRIDHAVVWTQALDDARVAALCGVAVVRDAVLTEAESCVADYRAFDVASRAKDVAACERLGVGMRRFMARDPRRPVWHLTAPMDTIFDPAGAFHHDGRYHVFSYRNPIGLLAFNSLSHFVSDDLVHWRDQPVALWPDAPVDQYGIWLTNLFPDDDGVITMLYTALGKRGKIGVLARSRDGIVTFGEKQAVMTSLEVHDGHVWKDGALWYAITTRQHWGRHPQGLGDEIVLLSSPDLVQWQERGALFSVPRDPAKADDKGFCEFPYLLPFGDRHVLMLGTKPVHYWVGRFDATVPRFTPDEPTPRRLDHLNPFFCFNPSAVDAKGIGGTPRRLVLAMESQLTGVVDGVPWSGVHLLPRALTRDGGWLRQEPVPELTALRSNHQQRSGITIAPGARGLLPGLSGSALELQAEFTPGAARRVGLVVRTSADGSGGVRILVDTVANEFSVDGAVRRSGAHPNLGRGPAHLTDGEPVRIRVFLDRSLLEVFVNGQSMSGMLTADPTAVGLDLVAEGGPAILTRLDLWEMRPAFDLGDLP